jgi:uncharacterized protein (TIGR03435 family)
VKSLAYCVVLFSAFFVTARLRAALPMPGAAAPPLRLSKLLQAPPGTRVDWPSLKGRTVILEFWATWCGPCVASIPHLNQLAASLDPHKFAFISVDDEDTAIVEAFLQRKKIASWVGLDANESTFKAFGVSSRPATIIVDKFGRIASVTTADKLTREGLMAIGSKDPAIPSKTLPESTQPIAKTKPQPEPVSNDDPTPLFELLIRPSVRHGQGFGMMHSTDGKSWGYLGVDAKFLLAQAYSIPGRRIKFVDSESTDVYDFLAGKANLDDPTFSRMVQTAVPAALGLVVTEKTQTADVLVLRASSASKNLRAAAPSEASYITFKDGKLLVSNSSFDQIAKVLEGHLNIGVLDETGFHGKYDAEIDVSSDDARGLTAAFAAELGIDLVSETSDVETLQVSRRAKGQ